MVPWCVTIFLEVTILLTQLPSILHVSYSSNLDKHPAQYDDLAYRLRNDPSLKFSFPNYLHRLQHSNLTLNHTQHSRGSNCQHRLTFTEFCNTQCSSTIEECPIARVLYTTSLGICATSPTPITPPLSMP